MKRLLVPLLVCLCALACLAGAASDRLTFTAGGFSIKPLEGWESLIMALPASGGFAPNVNVLIQPYSGTMDDYIAHTKKQFQESGLKAIGEAKEDKSTWVVEYSGGMAGRNLHWYAKAHLRGKKVYLVTATASEGQWSSLSGKLKACVDSFELATR